MFNNSVGLKLGKVSVKDPAAALMFDSCSAAADVKKESLQCPDECGESFLFTHNRFHLFCSSL